MNDSIGPGTNKPFDQRHFRDDITCAMPLLQAGKRWVSSQFLYISPECNEKDNKCYKMRGEYSGLSDLYQAIASHEEVAREPVKRAVENGDLSPCPEQSMWDKLLYEKPR